MTTRFLGNRPIRQRKPSGPAAAGAAAVQKENKENSPHKSPCKNRLDDKADVAGEDTLLAMLNDTKTPDRTVKQGKFVFFWVHKTAIGGLFRIPGPSR